MKRYLLLGAASAALVLVALSTVTTQPRASVDRRTDMGHSEATFDGGWHN